MTYKSIKIVKGNGGFGGPLVITPTEEKHKFIYVTGGGSPLHPATAASAHHYATHRHKQSLTFLTEPPAVNTRQSLTKLLN